MVCSCYYSFYFNALKRYPIPTPGVSLHNTSPIILVIIGDIPPGGIFGRKIQVWLQLITALKRVHFSTEFSTYAHVRRSIWIAQQQYCIYPLYTVIHSYHLIQSTQLLFISPPLNNIILFIPLSILLHCPIQSIKLLSFSTLYYIYYHIILFAISSPSILSIQSNLYYYISLPWYSYTIFNTISHRPISFYLIYYIISILYQYNIYYHII